MTVHPVAWMHARSLRWDLALTIALLPSPDAFAFDMGDAPMDENDRRMLRDACRALTYTCPGCGESRPVSDWSRDSLGCELCAACFDAAGLENEHADGYHDDDPCPDCALCGAVVS